MIIICPIIDAIAVATFVNQVESFKLAKFLSNRGFMQSRPSGEFAHMKFRTGKPEKKVKKPGACTR